MAHKISIYPTEEQRNRIIDLAKSEGLSVSQYLLRHGLQEKVYSDRLMAELASLACHIYTVADELESPEVRQELQRIGGEIYGLFKDPAS